jgi:phage-related minor tail protein
MMVDKITHEQLAKEHEQMKEDHTHMVTLLDDIQDLVVKHQGYIKNLSHNSVALAQFSKDISSNNRALIDNTKAIIEKTVTRKSVPLSVFFIVVTTICLASLAAIVSLANVSLVVEAHKIEIVPNKPVTTGKKILLKRLDDNIIIRTQRPEKSRMADSGNNSGE